MTLSVAIAHKEEALDPAHGTLRVVNGQPFYDGPLWKDIPFEGRTERIREGRAIGLSQRHISRLLGALDEFGKASSGAINGHIHRLKKKDQDVTSLSAPKKPVRPPRKANETKLKADKAEPKEAAPPVFSTEVTEKKAKEPPDRGYCTWPIGDPGTEGFRYCWLAWPEDLLPKERIRRQYCEHHHNLGLSSKAK